MNNQRLDKTSIKALVQLYKDIFPLSYTFAEKCCTSFDPIKPCIQTYGIFRNDMLVSVMTATYCFVMPCSDSPNGRIVHLSGAFTRPDYRHLGYASELLQCIEKDAKDYFKADYLCCDSIADDVYIKNGFILPQNNESRLWKKLDNK